MNIIINNAVLTEKNHFLNLYYYLFSNISKSIFNIKLTVNKYLKLRKIK